MSAPLNHELALARAHGHLQELERESARWRDADPYIVSHEFKAKTGEYVVWVEQVTPPEPETFSVIVGDCLHNLASSLNFLAYRLALARTDPVPEKVADKLEFPIFGDVDRQGEPGSGPRLFRKSRDRKEIRSLPPGAQTAIEELQPYKRGDAFTDDPLWKLYELARYNRHRFLHPAVAGFSGTSWNPALSSNARLGSGTLYSLGGFVEGRTKVASFPIRAVDPSCEVYVHIEPNIGVAFAKGTPVVAGESMVEVLSQIYNHIVFVVLDALRPHLS